MKRCIELAKNGLGTTYPNPLVGSVIVHNNKIIGEGWHQKSGEPHAEVNALNAVLDKSLLCDSTLYVNLEPCSHFGKTPPCCDLIIANGIPNIVIGTIDSNTKVAGTGIEKLKASGKNVIYGVLDADCRDLNRRFFTFQEKNRPYITLKWAESCDGFIAPLAKADQKPVWITNRFSRQLVHKWRSEEQAILVGSKTVIDDNPRLDVRDWNGNNPIRIVLNQNNLISKESHIFDNRSKTIVYSGYSDIYPAAWIASQLYEDDIQSVLIEGGRKTLQTFIDENMWDEARIFKGASKLHDGIKAPEITGNLLLKENILSDELLIFANHD